MQNSILKKEESIWRHIVNLEIIIVAIKALEWLSSRSVAEIMDKTSKIGENFSTHKPWRVENPLFYMANSRQRIELQIRSESGKTYSLDWKKQFSPCDFGLTGRIYKTTGSFDRSVKTIHDVNVLWECVNWAESLARNRAKFKCILGYSTSFCRVWWNILKFLVNKLWQKW